MFVCMFVCVRACVCSGGMSSGDDILPLLRALQLLLAVH